jgi:hypothetical protein
VIENKLNIKIMEIDMILSISVAILVALVTLLIGWQIWNVIFIEKKVRGIVWRLVKKETENLRKENYSNLAKSLLYQSITQLSHHNPNLFLTGIDALIVALENNTDNTEECIRLFLRKYKDAKLPIDPERLKNIRKSIYSTNIKCDNID